MRLAPPRKRPSAICAGFCGRYREIGREFRFDELWSNACVALDQREEAPRLGIEAFGQVPSLELEFRPDGGRTHEPARRVRTGHCMHLIQQALALREKMVERVLRPSPASEAQQRRIPSGA